MLKRLVEISDDDGLGRSLWPSGEMALPVIEYVKEGALWLKQREAPVWGLFTSPVNLWVTQILTHSRRCGSSSTWGPWLQDCTPTLMPSFLQA